MYNRRNITWDFTTRNLAMADAEGRTNSLSVAERYLPATLRLLVRPSIGRHGCRIEWYIIFDDLE